MKIVLCKSHLDGPISGADETLVTYATQLQKTGHDISVLLMYLHAGEDQYYQRLLDAGVAVSWIASDLAQTSLRAGRKLASRMFYKFPASKKFIRRSTQPALSAMANGYYNGCRDFLEKEKPDLAHVMTPTAGAMMMIRAAHDAGVPVIYQELGIPYHPPGFDYYREFASVLPLCSEIVALSPRLMEHCREKLAPRGALSILPIMSDEIVNGRPTHSREPDRVTFGFAARIEELKGPGILMEAFGVAHRRNPRISLNVAGDGSQRQKLAARAKALNVASRYRYHGVYTHPQERRAFMQSLDVFVMPSFTEGTPNSIVEAMAFGIPIIATEVGGIPDMLGKDSGVTVSPADSEALANAMQRLADDPELRSKMGRAGRERYVKLFSPEAVLPVLTSTYDRVISRHARQPLNQPAPNGRHPWQV